MQASNTFRFLNQATVLILLLLSASSQAKRNDVAAIAESESISTATSEKQCVVLLHGLARTERSMHVMADALREHAYFVVNQSYPSTTDSIEDLAIPAISNGIAQCPAQSKIHFVTHSMGGIVLRYYLANETLARMGRAVMLAPPNQGSEIVDTLGGWAIFKWLNGTAATQLGTGPKGMPQQLGPANFELGVVAGTKTFSPFMSLLLPNPDDGKVSVASTKLQGMKDHLILPVSHTFIMRSDKVIRQTVQFLKHGAFQRESESKNNS